MSYRVRLEDDPKIAQALHLLTFPEDSWEGPESGDHYWIARDKTSTPMGFASARVLEDASFGDITYMTRAGVLPCAAGAGLQRRLIRARVAWAKRQGHYAVITYTTLKNYPSITNLLRCGFRFYYPEQRWAGKEVHYFIKNLEESP